MKNRDNIRELFDIISRQKVMVIGDVMIDSYIYGKVDRISPEAPVPVVHISSRESRPGGAANVAINIKALGAIPILCTVTGDDEQGRNFVELMKKENLPVHGIMQSKDHITTIKTRVIGNNHQLLRVDDETIIEISGEAEAEFIKMCLAVMQNEKPDVIIFEDYDKGVITGEVIARITEAANIRNIPVTVDPKKKNFNAYRDVALFKPNLHELMTGLKTDIDKPYDKTLKPVIKNLKEQRNMKTVMVTLSDAGVFIASNGTSFTIPAHVRNISDVSGAGDTVISVASLCVAAGLPAEIIAGLSNLAGGLVCEMIGVVPVDKQRLMAEAEKNLVIPEKLKS